uniref:RNA-directed DNA polymerase, eukaryota, reverse transcriptase zinc-binding domain protein n=1 Tax=Tanacetum cinerariifolium TaxID=118510 RepID=A0A6L2MDL7_TANCI|nr:RNA-directed DNA polymerase, eukaryota, reverse transcriptase zinc-binding domain protein [Tanacetum cinerariifolium]
MWYYKNIFSKTAQDRLNFRSTRVSRLSYQEAKRREVKFSEKEIWDAVCGCSCDKALDPIGLSDVGGKSKAIGGEGSRVDQWAVERMARWMGCSVGELPLTYLGLPIGDEGTWKWIWDWVREPMGKVVGELEALEKTMSNTNITLNCRDAWKWMLDDIGAFPVKALSDLVEVKCINTRNHNSETMWNNLVTKKVNIFSWRAARGRLLVPVELDKKGIDLHTILCPNCDEMCETIDHSLIFYNEAMNVSEKVFEW